MSGLSLHAIDAGYPATRAKHVLNGVDLTLHAGQWCAICGPNGSGKSTLLRVAAGLLSPISGQVQLEGQPLSKLDRRSIAQNVALVPQHSEMAEGFTVNEVVAMGRAPHQSSMLRERDEDRLIRDEVIKSCDLKYLSQRSMETLSGGERQRVHLARALASKAPILLLDEPGAHLDIRHSEAIYRLIRHQVSEQRLVCAAVMHDLTAVARYADRVILLDQGAVRADGPPEQVLEDEILSKVFGTKLRANLEGPLRFVVPAART